jgi:hypothetical protein
MTSNNNGQMTSEGIQRMLERVKRDERRQEERDSLAHAPASAHYKVFAMEPIEYAEANNLGFSAGNVVKYVTRYRQKGGIEDLKKAKFYIEWLIKQEDQRGNTETP